MAGQKSDGTGLRWRPGTRPTLAQVKRWPATVSVEWGAAALGCGRATAYQAIADGTFPVATIHVRRRRRVLTADLLRVLEGESGEVARSA